MEYERLMLGGPSWTGRMFCVPFRFPDYRIFNITVDVLSGSMRAFIEDPGPVGERGREPTAGEMVYVWQAMFAVVDWMKRKFESEMGRWSDE